MKPINWKKLGRFFLDNVDNILAAVLCVIAGIYSLVGGKSVSDPWMLSAVTWALGLIALGSIKDRKAREKLERLTENLRKPAQASDVLKDRDAFRPFREVTASAQEIWLFGATLVNLIGPNENHFREILNNHPTKVKILILDEGSPAVSSAAECLDTVPSMVTDEIDRVGAIIRSLSSKCKNPNSSIELRKISAFPNYGLMIVDPLKPSGFMTVEYNGYNNKEMKSLRPHVELTKMVDSAWFELYVDEFNRMWDEGKLSLSSPV